MEGLRIPDMRADDPPTKATVRRKSLDRPDGHREFAHGVGDFVDVGSAGVGRAILEPGWRWSVDVKPAVGSESCQIHHLHLLLAGRLAFQMDDGEIHEFEPNDVMDIPPGHDAWTVGDERVVLIDISGNVTNFGLPPSTSRAVATMLMTDIVGSTDIAAGAGDAAWSQRLGEHNRVVRRQLEKFRGREIDTTGDGFLAIFDSAQAAILAGLAVRDAVDEIGLQVRVGVHSGEIELAGDDVRGIAVHAAARVMAAAAPSQVLTSSLTRALAEGVACTFKDHGEYALKGIAEPMRLLSVER